MLFVSSPLQAQITVSNASFPVANDILSTANDSVWKPTITAGSASAQTWNYAALQAFTYDTTFFSDADSGMFADSFPNADVRINFFLGEAYIETLTNQMDIIGFSGDVPVINITLTRAFDQPQIYRRSNITYGSINNDTASFEVTLDGSIIPAGTLPATPDSVRFAYLYIGADTVDAFGSITTPTGTFDVIRQKRNTFTDVVAEALSQLLVGLMSLPSCPTWAQDYS